MYLCMCVHLKLPYVVSFLNRLMAFKIFNLTLRFVAGPASHLKNKETLPTVPNKSVLTFEIRQNIVIRTITSYVYFSNCFLEKGHKT